VVVIMRRRILIVLLAIGTIAGYSAGFRSMRHCNANRGWEAPRHGMNHDAFREGYEKGYADALQNQKSGNDK
jgi:hypothetical protein